MIAKKSFLIFDAMLKITAFLHLNTFVWVNKDDLILITASPVTRIFRSLEVKSFQNPDDTNLWEFRLRRSPNFSINLVSQQTLSKHHVPTLHSKLFSPVVCSQFCHARRYG